MSTGVKVLAVFGVVCLAFFTLNVTLSLAGVKAQSRAPVGNNVPDLNSLRSRGA